MNVNKIGQYIPLVTVTGIVIYSIIETKFTTEIDSKTGKLIQYVVIDEIYYACIGLAVVFILAILKIRFWKHLFTLILFVTTLGFIQFTSYTFGLNFGFFKIEIIGLSLLILQLSFSGEPVNDLANLLINPEKTKPNKPVTKEPDVQRFINKFESKSILELKTISESEKYTIAAREAAARLILKE